MAVTGDLLRDYGYAYKQPEFVAPAPKYDNRVVAVRSVRLWAEAQDSREKIATAFGELPDNPAPELFAMGYAELFQGSALAAGEGPT